MKDNIDTITRRTQGYWYIDGLAEMTIGLFFRDFECLFHFPKADCDRFSE